MAANERARLYPDELLCVAIDGSDQSSYATPYFRQDSKESCKGWKMRHRSSCFRADVHVLHREEQLGVRCLSITLTANTTETKLPLAGVFDMFYLCQHVMPSR